MVIKVNGNFTMSNGKLKRRAKKVEQNAIMIGKNG
jgi:hypothetical protein